MPEDSTTFLRIAEGYTRGDVESRMRVSFRLFSLEDIERMCAAKPSPVVLGVPSQPIQLQVGLWYDLNDLGISATATDGTEVPGLPIVIEAQLIDPEVVNLEAAQLSSGRVLPMREGTLLLRVRAVCGETPAPLTLPVVVREPSET